MKKQTRFGFQIAWELNKHKMSQGELATRAGLSQGVISQLIANERKRADPATLKALCQSWPDYQTSVRCIAKHLQDELQRAGFDPDGTLGMIPLQRNATKRQRVLADLSARALLDDDIYALLADLLKLVSKIPAEIPAEQPGIAAEPRDDHYSASAMQSTQQTR